MCCNNNSLSGTFSANGNRSHSCNRCNSNIFDFDGIAVIDGELFSVSSRGSVGGCNNCRSCGCNCGRNCGSTGDFAVVNGELFILNSRGFVGGCNNCSSCNCNNCNSCGCNHRDSAGFAAINGELFSIGSRSSGCHCHCNNWN